MNESNEQWNNENYQRYYKWFGERYLADKVAADFYAYNGHTPIDQFILDNVDFSLEDREGFWLTLDQILKWRVTTDCPSEEIC